MPDEDAVEFRMTNETLLSPLMEDAPRKIRILERIPFDAKFPDARRRKPADDSEQGG